MNVDAARAWAFIRRGELRGAHEEPSPLGTAVSDARFPLRHDSNYLFVERPASAAEVLEETRRLGLPVALVADESLVPDAEPMMRGVLMVHRGPRRPPANPARRAGMDEVAPLRRELILHAPWGTPETADSLLGARAELASRIAVTHFVAEANDEIVAYTDLFVDGADAQIEDVATVPAHRRRGHGTDVVLTALAEAPAFVFLVADADDWPREWYARLGFEEVGRYVKLSAAR